MPMGGIGSIGQDPNQAAKLFAEKAGISIGEAKTALKALPKIKAKTE